MNKLNEIKLTDLIAGEKINVKELSEIKGGFDIVLRDGCYSGICSIKINPEYCTGAAVCTSGIGG